MTQCQVILPRLKTDLVKILNKATSNELKTTNIKWKKEKSMTIVLCSKGYPGKYKKNIKLDKIKNLRLSKNDYIFHAGTKILNNNFFSSGGRILNITSTGNNFFKIRNNILKILKKLKNKNVF